MSQDDDHELAALISVLEEVERGCAECRAWLDDSVEDGEVGEFSPHSAIRSRLVFFASYVLFALEDPKPRITPKSRRSL